MRTPFQQPRERRPLRIRADLAEGFRFLWTQPFLRATSFFYAIGNFTIPALLFVVLVVARGHGLTGGEIGVLFALFSACILIGSLLAGAARRRLSLRAVVMLEAYSGLLAVLFLIEPNVYLLLGALLPQAFVLPITDSYVIAHRLAATPGPPARPGRGGARDHRPHGGPARLTHCGRSAQCNVGARRGRGVPRPDVWGGGVRDRSDGATVATATRGPRLNSAGEAAEVMRLDR